MSMSDVRRLFSRREKKTPGTRNEADTSSTGASNTDPTPKPAHFRDVFSTDVGSKAKVDKDEERAVLGILERLRSYGIQTMVESNARYAIRSCKGDADEAFKLLMLLQETYEGLVKPFDPKKKLLGAVNRQSVTCYLDALLFAMFVRLDSFEAMLYDSLEDNNKRRLAGMLRLWVNLLRTGRLITTDVTNSLQEALAACGWTEAARLRQQDPSEAFTFITDQLQLPLLTLKMDLYHTGKDDPTDDHKFVNERLLEVAILEKSPDGRNVITLEDCLEHYFNNRIEVKRHLENQRRNTLKTASDTTFWVPIKAEKETGLHVEIAEVPGTPIMETPVTNETLSPWKAKEQSDRTRPGMDRKRQDSIFSQRKVEVIGIDPEHLVDDAREPKIERKLSTKTEVLMPAWQFFKLLPWYTDHLPTSDAQVAAHFSMKRPVLGICLKRYSFTNEGRALRLDSYIDIPLEITVPNFVSDDHLDGEIDSCNGPIGGNFRLLLQSVVCHRGNSVHSGHYISLCRSINYDAQLRSKEFAHSDASSENDDVEQRKDPWMRFDDLAAERVTYVDIQDALKKELPYLLFYQVQPIDADGRVVHDLPSYAEATSRSQSMARPIEYIEKSELPYSGTRSSLDMTSATDGHGRISLASNDADAAANSRLESQRSSAEVTRSGTQVENKGRRPSAALDAFSVRTEGTDPAIASIPSTPSAEELAGNSSSLLGIASKMSTATGSRRGSRVSRGSNTFSNLSRPGSSGTPSESASGSRLSLNLSKLTQKISRGDKEKDKERPRDSSMQPSVAVARSSTDGDISGPEFISANSSEQRNLSPRMIPGERTTTIQAPAKEGVDQSIINVSKHQRHDQRKASKRKKIGLQPDDRDCVVM